MSTYIQPEGTKKVRVQVDLSEAEALMLNHLAIRLSVRSRAERRLGVFMGNQ